MSRGINLDFGGDDFGGLSDEEEQDDGKTTEEGTKEDIAKVKSAFQQRSEAEQKRFELATDSEYWLCVCFQSRDQKEEFLQASGLEPLGDKYLDGWEVAKKLGVKIARAEVPYNTSTRQDKKLIDLT